MNGQFENTQIDLGPPNAINAQDGPRNIGKYTSQPYVHIFDLMNRSIFLRVRNAGNRIEKGATFIHPSNDDDVIYGQGTAAIELLEDCPDLDYIFAPVGGGGLLAGTLLAAKHFSKNSKVIAGEPKAVNDAYRSLLSGKIEKNKTTNTIADGLRTHLGDRNFPIIKKYVDKII